MSGRTLLIIFFVGLVGYKANEFYQSKKLADKMSKVHNTPLAAVQYGVPANCAGKKHCITVFVAPWCPACQSAKGTFKMLNDYLPKNRSDVGFGIVVGAGSQAENNEEKTQLAPIEVLVDHSGQIFKNRRINSFPTWIVNDVNGKEIAKKAGTPVINDQGQLPLLLSQFLGL